MDINQILDEIDNESVALSLEVDDYDTDSRETSCTTLYSDTHKNELINFVDTNTTQNAQNELDSIQKDLDNLMDKLNVFICDCQEENNCDTSSSAYSYDETTEDTDSETEKQDGPPEKELCKNGDYLITNGSSIYETNWEAVGPIIQKHVNDLQRLHNLNIMMNSVVKRIKNITQINDAILKLKREEDAF